MKVLGKNNVTPKIVSDFYYSLLIEKRLLCQDLKVECFGERFFK